MFDHTPVQFPPLRPANWDFNGIYGGADWVNTSARSNNTQLNMNPQELCGVRGNSVDTAWQVTTGSPQTVIAVTDSGIEWCDPDLVNKIYVNRAAVPLPENATGLTKPELAAHGTQFADTDPYDLDNSGILNVAQYVNDPRVAAVAKDYGGLFCAAQRQYGYTGISSEDLIRTFGTPTLPGGSANPYYYGRSGPAGFTEAISGWSFVDNTNDPYDVVHYDHGTGEAEDSGVAGSATSVRAGICANCMILPVRVGDSFIASSNAFAEGVLFSVDSGASVIQEALGTLDVTETAREAVDYAQAHGVPIIASAADEHAEHHNQPAALAHTIVVNSVAGVNATTGKSGTSSYNPPSYLFFNRCTNYGANIAVSAESQSCSSAATGKVGGITGLVEAAGAAALANRAVSAYPGLTTAAGAPVALSVNEVKQLVTMSASSIDFGTAAPPYGPPDNYAVVAETPTTRFPTYPGFTPYFGYGRINASKLVHWVSKGWIPPEAEITGLPWFQSFSPRTTLAVRGLVGTPRPCPGTPVDSGACPWRAQVQIGVGAGPQPGTWHTVASTQGQGVVQGVLAQIPLERVAALFPVGTNFSGGPVGPTGRPAADAFTFTIRVVVEDSGTRPMVGMARRAEFLHSNAGLVFGQPRYFGGSIDASPTLAPIGPGGSDVLLVATTDGAIHALLPDGSELPGWPVHTAIDTGYHPGELAYTSGAVTAVPHGEPMDTTGGLAVGDLSDASAPCLHQAQPSGSCLDVVVTDYSGRVYAFNSAGTLLSGFPVRTDPAFSGPAVANQNNRVLRGIFSAPALADLQGNGTLDIVAAAMDRHVYAWQPDGAPVPGWPVLVVDPTKVASVNPTTNQVSFTATSNVTQGSKLMDTPAIGNLTGGSGPPDVIVGSNEEYNDPSGTSVADPLYTALTASLLSTANSRVYAIYPNGALHPAAAGTPAPSGYPNPGAFLPGWPVAA
ncbi:MAG: S8/S53 family peptidase, partial [Mycobacteriales bacterium]